MEELAARLEGVQVDLDDFDSVVEVLRAVVEV